MAISFLIRLFRGSEPAEPPEPIEIPTDEPVAPEPVDVAPVSSACPYCAESLIPPPTRSRLCPHCRQPIALRRLDGRIVLLAEDAVRIFDEQQQKELDETRWATDTGHWLGLAATVGATAARRSRLAAASPSADTVEASRALYLAAAEAAVHAARGEKRWNAVSRIQRAQAANLYIDSGRPIPPPPAVLELQRDALLAELRALKVTSKVAELVGAGCCAACRSDDGRSFPIAGELRKPRLPHDDCPKGLCGCDWFIAKASPAKPRRRRSTPAA
jgi:hypothetical protein